MNQSTGEYADHPLLTAVRVIDAALDDTAGVDPDWLPPQVKGPLLVDLARTCERLTALKLRVLAGADDVAAQTGARSAAAWLAHHTRVPPGRLVADAALATRLTHTYTVTGEAYAAGRVTRDHAAAVTDSLDALPASVDPDTRAKAERMLLEYCEQFTPKEVRRLGRRILHTLDPALADAEDARALEAEERRAEQATRVTLTPLGDGRTRLAGEIPDLTAGILTRALDAYTNPRRPGTGGSDPVVDPVDPATGRRRSAAERRGHAFCALVEHLPVDGLPSTGGTPINIVVTIDLDTLRHHPGFTTHHTARPHPGPTADTNSTSSGITGTREGRSGGTGCTDTGVDVSAGQVRRLACQHHILPAVLGGASVPLDLGRAQRLFTHHQAKAHALTHPHCQAHGCTIPAAWCERHHKTSWVDGGLTDLQNLAFLCSWHHHRAHDPAYTHHWDGDTIAFHRRT